MRMPKNKDGFERAILFAFDAGMQAGYGVGYPMKRKGINKHEKRQKVFYD